MQIHLTDLNITAAANLLRPVLKSPISQVVISFAVGYFATTKISQLLAILCKSISNGSSKQHEMNVPVESIELPHGKDAVLLSVCQLSVYNGLHVDQPIYTALNGKIYDLSPSREKFSNHGPYTLLAGCDANHVLSIACSSLGVSTEDIVQRWERSLNAEFKIVGYLIDAEMPKEHDCNHEYAKNNEDDVTSVEEESKIDVTSDL